LSAGGAISPDPTISLVSVTKGTTPPATTTSLVAYLRETDDRYDGTGGLFGVVMPEGWMPQAEIENRRFVIRGRSEKLRPGAREF